MSKTGYKRKETELNESSYDSRKQETETVKQNEL
jgi:hypothetical protein